MSEPDYSNTSLKELYGVLRSIDGRRFPERLTRAKEEISRREAASGEVVEIDLEVPIPVLAALRGAFWLVCLNALVLVLSQIWTLGGH